MDENDDPLVDSQNIVNGWKHFFSRLLYVGSVRDIRQIEILTAEPL
jgi:hypothetical protein